MSEKVRFCSKHGQHYVHECHECHREDTKCIHGVHFDSECGECMEDKHISDIVAMRTKGMWFDFAKTLHPVHPLKNPDSKHYEMIDGVEAIERLEQMYSTQDLMAWAKISAMKYRLRITNKDAVEKEAIKIKGFEAYYAYLEKKCDDEALTSR